VSHFVRRGTIPEETATLGSLTNQLLSKEKKRPKPSGGEACYVAEEAASSEKKARGAPTKGEQGRKTLDKKTHGLKIEGSKNRSMKLNAAEKKLEF